MLFDLDGTLVDTAPDMAWALNALRAEQALEPMPYEAIRPSVSHGSNAMVRIGFGDDLPGARFETLRKRFLDLYQGHLAEHSSLFPGMDQVLAWLENSAVSWGVVTNKPGWLTEPLLEALGLAPRAACIVSGDTLAQRKPDPAPLLHACELTGHEAGACVYVGDAERDIEAGRRAGMHTLIAGFGYLSEEDQPADWGADGHIASPLELLDWLRHAC